MIEIEPGMRVAFIGAHGTGKTSLVDAIAKLMGLPVIKEQAREVATEWGYTPATIPAAHLWDYQKEVVLRQVGKERAYDTCGFVSDRSVVDNMAYFKLLAEANNWPSERHGFYQSMFYERIDRYDMLIHIPIMFPLVDDGQRHTDPTFQLEVDRLIRHLIQVHNLRDKIYSIQREGIVHRLPELQEAIIGWDHEGRRSA